MMEYSNDVNDNSSLSANTQQNVHDEMVELQITNLDRAIPPNQLKDILLQLFNREVVPILDIAISFLSDGKPQAIVKLTDQEAAKLAIFRLHRKKLGNKRIYLSHRAKAALGSLRSKVVSVLLSIPGGRTTLPNFRQLYEKRFRSSIKLTDICRMKDVVQIQDDVTGKAVQLNSSITNSDTLPGLEAMFCEKHSRQIGEDEITRSRPVLMLHISLTDLSLNICKLLKEHGGRIPMSCLTDCYRHSYGEAKEVDANAVPFLHLVTCLKGVRIIFDENGVKSLVDSSQSCANLIQSGEVRETHSQHLANQFAQFSRELVDLIKTWPGCRMPFNKFIPSFHHYFGRQCRVADYGYTKLRDLFEAMPHVVHVLGDGNKAIITLSKRAQVRRFTADLVKVLKAEKQINLASLPDAYLVCHAKPFRISDFGVCRVEDMMDMLQENTVSITYSKEERNVEGISELGSVTGSLSNIVISLPRRELPDRTSGRIQQFAKEVMDLLKHSPDCTLHFNKFIPAFHHHFGVQCRVADYGFEKLIDLFEAIPKIVDFSEDSDGEKLIELTYNARLKVLGEQMQKLVEDCQDKTGLLLSSLVSAFRAEYGYPLRPDMFRLESINQLIDLVPDEVKIVRVALQDYLVASEKGVLASLERKLVNLLYSKVGESCTLNSLATEFKQLYDADIGGEILNNFKDIIVEEGKVRLSKQAVLIKDIESILQDGRLTISQLECEYETKYSRKLSIVDSAYADLLSFVSNLPSLSIRGQGHKLTVGLQEYRDSSSISKQPKLRPTSYSQGVKRFAVNSTSPEFGTLPPPPPQGWLRGEITPVPQSMFASETPSPDLPCQPDATKISGVPLAKHGNAQVRGFNRNSSTDLRNPVSRVAFGAGVSGVAIQAGVGGGSFDSGGAGMLPTPGGYYAATTPPLIYRSGLPTPPPAMLNAVTPPPPPVAWGQTAAFSAGGCRQENVQPLSYFSFGGSRKDDDFLRKQTGCQSKSLTDPTAVAVGFQAPPSAAVAPTAATAHNPIYQMAHQKQTIADGTAAAATIYNPMFYPQPPKQAVAVSNCYQQQQPMQAAGVQLFQGGQPWRESPPTPTFWAQGVEPMTPPGSAKYSYVQQYQLSPLTRAAPFGSTQFYQINAGRAPVAEICEGVIGVGGGVNGAGICGGGNGAGFGGGGGNSLFSHSFAVPIPPRSQSSQQQAFAFTGFAACSPTVAGSPLSPSGLATGLYHIPPINTNSPDTGLADHGWMKSIGRR